MKFGLMIFPTEYAISPAELAVAAEQRGFESLWLAEHSHIPTSRESPWPGGADLPKMYYDAMDPFVALASAASVTSEIKLGTGICLVIQRDPIQTAKQVASLDRLSQGRFLFGVGGGWNREEMANHGTDYDRRWKVLRERIEAMKAIWTQDEAEYHGEFVDFDPIFAWPKPLQQPHPPIHVGGVFPGGARRSVRYGDGWMPLIMPGHDLIEEVAGFRRLAEEAGRDPATLELTLYGTPPKAELIAAYRDAGFDRVIFGLPPKDRDAILPLLDKDAALMAEVGG